MTAAGRKRRHNRRTVAMVRRLRVRAIRAAQRLRLAHPWEVSVMARSGGEWVACYDGPTLGVWLWGFIREP